MGPLHLCAARVGQRLDSTPMARVAVLHKSGPLGQARSYKPNSVSMGMYAIMARLLRNVLRDPIQADLHKRGAARVIPQHCVQHLR